MEYPDSPWRCLFIPDPKWSLRKACACWKNCACRKDIAAEKDIAAGKDKNIKNPLWLMQNVSYEPLMLRPVENP